jgi:hypothetical protein
MGSRDPREPDPGGQGAIVWGRPAADALAVIRPQLRAGHRMPLIECLPRSEFYIDPEMGVELLWYEFCAALSR